MEICIVEDSVFDIRMRYGFFKESDNELFIYYAGRKSLRDLKKRLGKEFSGDHIFLLE